MTAQTYAEQFTRSALILLILSVFFLIPLRIIAYGYVPTDDALRHAAFVMFERNWGDIILLDPQLPAWMDLHPGWHAFLRAVQESTGWDQGRLVSFSVVLAFWTFAYAGAAASGNPPAWFLSCALMSVLEPALLGKLLLGRPLFFSMAAVAVLMFLWTRREPLRFAAETAAVFVALALAIFMHPSYWYLWAIMIPPLVVCRQWRSLLGFLVGWVLALGVACAANGWFDTIALPVEVLRRALFQDGTLGPNLVSEFQPTGGPLFSVLLVLATLFARKTTGADMRAEIFKVDLALVVLAWVMGLFVGRFWVEWGLPAMAVWFARQMAEGLGLGLTGFKRWSDTALVFGVAAASLYLAQTADVGGRYTNPLRDPLLFSPVEDFASELPEAGGVLYSADMRLFYTVFHRIPDARFRFATAMEPGFMPPEDLKVLRAIQTHGLVRDYKPWFEKMTAKDRVLLRWSTKPEWPGMEFRSFYGAWMGRKVAN